MKLSLIITKVSIGVLFFNFCEKKIFRICNTTTTNNNVLWTLEVFPVEEGKKAAQLHTPPCNSLSLSFFFFLAFHGFFTSFYANNLLVCGSLLSKNKSITLNGNYLPIYLYLHISFTGIFYLF